MKGVGWVIADDYGARTLSELSPDERFFVENADRANLIAEAGNDQPYEYDDDAIYELDGVLYWFNTSGCSCPSPTETWHLVRKGTEEDMLPHLQPVAPDSYNQATNKLINALKKAGWDLPDAPTERKYDW